MSNSLPTVDVEGKGPVQHFTEITGLVVALHGIVIECWSLTGELSLSCARPAADGRPFMWVNRPLLVSQPGRLNLSFFRGR